MADDQYDIAVVGAGPAGLMACRYAAMGGRSVCLFDRKKAIGEPVRCGEAVGKGLAASLDIEPEWIRARVNRVRMISPCGTRVQLENIGESLVIDRVRMEQDLLKRAVDAGVVYRSATTVTSVARDSGGVYTLECASTRVSARCVVLADGVESRLARRLGWKTALRMSDIESCAFCRLRHQAVDNESLEFFVGSTYAPGGFVWVFPRGDTWANVGLGVLGTRSSPGLARDLLARFVKHHYSGAEVVDLHCGGVPVGRWVRPLVRGGALLAGDAARQMNCLNGAGIGYATFAGRAAGEVIAASFSADGTVDCDRLQAYEQRWAEFYGKQQQRSFELKSVLLERTSDVFLDRLARALAKKDPRRMGYMGVFVRVFARHPLLLLKVARLFR